MTHAKSIINDRAQFPTIGDALVLPARAVPYR